MKAIGASLTPRSKAEQQPSAGKILHLAYHRKYDTYLLFIMHENPPQLLTAPEKSLTGRKKLI